MTFLINYIESYQRSVANVITTKMEHLPMSTCLNLDVAAKLSSYTVCLSVQCSKNDQQQTNFKLKTTTATTTTAKGNLKTKPDEVALPLNLRSTPPYPRGVTPPNQYLWVC